jgi:hypothetical protein
MVARDMRLSNGDKKRLNMELFYLDFCVQLYLLAESP